MPKEEWRLYPIGSISPLTLWGPRMMPDERMLQDVMPSTMHMTLDSFTLLHVLMLPKRHSSVPKHPCIQRG